MNERAHSNDPLFRSVFLRYARVGDNSLSVTHGRELHAAFLKAVDVVSPSLAQRLHDAPGFRPFTIAIIPSTESSPVPSKHAIERFITIRITSLDDELSVCLDDVIAAGLGRVRLGRVALQLQSVGRTPDEHPDAVSVRSSTISDYWLREHGADGRGVFASATIQFLTPTTFKHKGINLPLPLPDRKSVV